MTELEYFLSFAMSICLRKIEDIERVWVGGDVTDISKYESKQNQGFQNIGKKQILRKLITTITIINLGNSIHSLNQLKSTCSNVKWVSSVLY